MKQQQTETQTADRLRAEYARTHDPKIREALVGQFERLARSIASRDLHRTNGNEDLFPATITGLTRAEAQVCIHQLLHHLGEPLREVIRLRYLAGLGQRAVAVRLGFTPMQVCRLEKQALEQLRGHLATH